MWHEWSTLKKLIWLRFLKATSAVIQTVTGSSPLVLENAISATIHSLIQYGKCTQATTPTPDSPVDIVCNNGTLTMVDDELPSGYKRITGIKFDGDFWYETGESLTGDDDVTMTLADTVTSGQNVFGSYNGTASGAVNFSLFIYGGGSSTNSYFRYGEQLLRPKFGSNERTITFGKSGTSGFATDVTVTPKTFTTPANAYIGMLPNSSSPAFTGSIIGNILVGNRLKYIPCERQNDSVIGYYEAVKGVFLEPSGTGTPIKDNYDTSHLNVLSAIGTPEVLSVGGKNLNGGTIEHKGYTSTGGESTSTTFAGTLWKIPCYAGQKFTVSWGGFPDGVSGVFINTWLTDGTWNLRQAISASTSLTYVVRDGVGTINFTLYKTGGVTIGEDAWIQVEYGESATEYQPYITPQTVTDIPMLLGVGDYKDEAEIIGGLLTHKVGAIVLDGTENVSASGAGWAIAIGDKLRSKVALICTHYPYSAATMANAPDKSIIAFSSQNIGIKDSSLTSATEVKAFLAEARPIVIYPLAEETTEQTTAHELHTAAGTNTVSVTSNVDPVDLKVEYKATN